MKKTQVILALLMAAGSAGSAFAVKTPDFKIAKVLNAPVTKVSGISDFKGKVVFVEFWATWCGPCVASIPHMNRLSDKFKGEPVVFLSVTDESSGTIAAFLKTHEMKAWAGIDEAKSSLKAFKVYGRPDGYLIGKDGNLLARIYPAHLKEQDITEAIAGQFKPRPVEWESPETPKKDAAAGKTLFEIRIATAAGKWMMSSGSDKLELQSVPFAYGIAHIWDVEDSQILADTQPVSSFNATLRTPRDNYDRGLELLKSAVQATFGVNIAAETRETDVFLLALSTAASAARPNPGAPEVHLGLLEYGGTRLIGTAEMPKIARALWKSLDRPVLDETGLKGTYEFELDWEKGGRPELDRLLAERGLALVPARRAVEFLRITPAKP